VWDVSCKSHAGEKLRAEGEKLRAEGPKPEPRRAESMGLGFIGRGS